MRTKTLLVAGAISALALTASLAQSVYSVNVVGYVNVPIVQGFNCIANPLDAQPDNTLNSVLPSAPDGASLMKWTGTAFTEADNYFEGYGWRNASFEPSTTTVATGEGFFVLSPVATNFTFVGDVRQGPLSSSMIAGFNLLANLTPQSGQLVRDFTMPSADGDSLLYWNPTTQKYTDAYNYFEGYGWRDADFNEVFPTIDPGQGFFLLKLASATWSVTFNVQ